MGIALRRQHPIEAFPVEVRLGGGGAHAFGFGHIAERQQEGGHILLGQRRIEIRGGLFRIAERRVAWSRDRALEAGLFGATLVVIAAIVFWNSTYLADAIDHMRAQGKAVPAELLAQTSPLTWEHIGFSGDFLWDRAAATADHRRPLNLGRERVAA